MSGEREYPERPVVGAGAVIVRSGKVALVRRARAPRRGEWSIPGGVVEAGESLRQAAEREAQEETGLVVRAGALLEVFESITPGARGKTRFHYVVVDFLCRPERGELRAGGDAGEARWFGQRELQALALPEATRRVIEKGLRQAG